MFVWEGTGVDANELTINAPANPTVDQAFTFPDDQLADDDLIVAKTRQEDMAIIVETGVTLPLSDLPDGLSQVASRLSELAVVPSPSGRIPLFVLAALCASAAVVFVCMSVIAKRRTRTDC